MHARVPSEGERSFFSLCRERTWGGGERSGGRTETRAEERRGAEGRRGSSARNLKWDPSLMMIWICRAALRLFVCPSSRSTCFAEKSRIAPAAGAVRARGKFFVFGQPAVRSARRFLWESRRGRGRAAVRAETRRAKRSRHLDELGLSPRSSHGARRSTLDRRAALGAARERNRVRAPA